MTDFLIWRKNKLLKLVKESLTLEGKKRKEKGRISLNAVLGALENLHTISENIWVTKTFLRQ